MIDVIFKVMNSLRDHFLINQLKENDFRIGAKLLENEWKMVDVDELQQENENMKEQITTLKIEPDRLKRDFERFMQKYERDFDNLKIRHRDSNMRANLAEEEVEDLKEEIASLQARLE